MVQAIHEASSEDCINLNFPDLLHIINGGSLLIPAHRRPLLCGFHVSPLPLCVGGTVVAGMVLPGPQPATAPPPPLGSCLQCLAVPLADQRDAVVVLQWLMYNSTAVKSKL